MMRIIDNLRGNKELFFKIPVKHSDNRKKYTLQF